MLNERDSLILENAVMGLVSSFDPLDAMQSLPIRDLFTTEQFNQIRSTRSRASRISLFFRVYVRRSSSLQLLRDYFERSTQHYLAELLSGVVSIPSDSSNSQDVSEIQTHPRILHALSETMVPPRSKHHVCRPALVKRLCNKLVSLASEEAFWLVIDGIAGSGKTSLIVDVLRDCPQLLSLYYSDVLWIRDKCIQRNKLSNMYAHASVIVTQAEILERVCEDSEAINLELKKCILTMPFPLVIVDEIYLEESVRWFDSLNCRIVATTSNRGVFRSAGNPVQQLSLDSRYQFTVEEARILFAVCKPMPSTCFLNNIIAESGGNPALLVKMKEISRNRTDRLQRCFQLLKEGSLQRLKCSTSYPYASLHEAIDKMTLPLSDGEKEALRALTCFEPGTTFSLKDAASVMPIDVCGNSDLLQLALDMLDRIVDCNLLEETEAESDLDALGDHYSYQMSQ